jgi:transcriptional regulator with XRE-family HTH domain
MILADKIIHLRKKNGWSQEELAEKMNVSRQAVSKWESAQTVPDLQKILQLASLFGVTTDYLLKDNIEDAQYTTDEPSEARKVSLAMAQEYLKLRKSAAKSIALATVLCILSVVPLILIGALSDLKIIDMSDNVAGVLGLCILFVFVGIAVAIYIFTGSKSAEYSFLCSGNFEREYGVDGLLREKQKSFRPVYVRANLIGTLLCIFSPLPLIISAIAANDILSVLALCFLFLAVAIGVYFFINAGVQWASIRRLQDDPEYIDRKLDNSSLSGTVISVYWAIVTAIYFLWSFIGGDWHISWVIWIIAGILQTAVTSILDYIENKK